ncbi:MAG: zinc-dependent metalloprotease [Deltaproteobacteria bacterium]|nr:zinc-dependent metalloprotease [Deltaproteobacteria bacterium]
MRRSLLLLVALAGCECVEPIANPDPLPPYLLQKATFEDGAEWWLQRTVIDVPYVAQFTFVGDGDYPDRVRFQVEEDFLIAVRTTPVIVGASPDTAGVNDYEAPVAFWPIKRHFDVIEGQIIEVPKRPWYERGWFEVDWAHEQSGTYRFTLGAVEQVAREVPAYYEMRPDDENAPIFSADYVDFTTHLTIKATEGDDPEGIRHNLCLNISSSATAVDALDCAPLDVAFRTSLYRIPADHDYEPLKRTRGNVVDNRWFFRFFRMGNLTLDDEYGLADRGVDLNISRYNTWVDAFDAAGARIPLYQRGVKQIPFHVLGGFPTEMLPELQAALDEWNGAMRTTLVEASTWECVDAGAGDSATCRAGAEAQVPASVLVLCPNAPVQEGDAAACGEPGTAARFGDLRRNVVLWNTAPTLLHFLGIGWWSPDPSNGEIISSHMTVWGSDVDRAAAQARDAVLLAQGRLSPEEITSGGYIVPYLDDLQSLSNDPYAPLAPPALGAAPPPPPDGAPPPPSDGQRGAIATVLGGLPQVRADALAPAIGTPYELLALDPEDLLLRGLDPLATELTQQTVAQVSSLRQPYHQSQDARNKLAARIEAVGGDLDLPADLDIASLVEDFAGADPEAIYQFIRLRYARWVFTHELGHILGLRHNFGGSYDAMNYQPEYWALRNDGSLGPRYLDPLTQAERDGDIDSFAYASIMDYYSSAAGAPTKLGYYDKAAIAYGYGSLVEVFNDITPAGKDYLRFHWLSPPLNVAAPVIVPDATRPSGHRHTGLHYSKLRSVLGDLSARSFVPLSHLQDVNLWGELLSDESGRVVVPYNACTDGYSDVTAWCLRYDKGGDPYEIITSTINWYRSYYVFNSFRRGRADFSSADYTDQIWSRVFAPIRNLYAFSLHFRWEYEPEAFDDPDFLEPLAAGVDESFTFLVRLLAQPQPGAYFNISRPDGFDWLVPTNAFTDDLSPYDPTIFHPGVEPLPDPSQIVMTVPVGSGRYYRSFDIDNLREELVLKNVGNAVDKEMALETLLDPRFWTFSGMGSWADSRLWMVNYSRTYPDQLLDVLGSIVAGDVNRVSPVWNGTDVTYRDFRDVTSAQPAGTPLDPAIGFNLRIRTLVYGLGLHLADDSDRSMLDSARVVLVGTGEEPTSTAPSIDFVDDIYTGKTYRAFSQVVDGVELGIGARLIARAQVLHDAALGLGGQTADEQYDAERMLRDQVDLLDIARGLTRRFEESPFDGNAIADPTPP